MDGIVDKIRNAGVIGAGGAGFPTHIKIYSSHPEYVIANGAECEPLLRVDQQVMEFHASDVVAGLRLIMDHTGAKFGVIALKDHYRRAIDALKNETNKKGIILHIMNSFYPAGDEQQLVYDIMGRVVPTGGIPLDVGAVVMNVSTLMNVAAADRDIPVTEKYVTVGGAVRHPVTLKAPIGISMKRLIEEAGGTIAECGFIVGGPCMGYVAADADISVGKTTGGIIALPKEHPLFSLKNGRMDLQLIKAVCCQCSICTQMCPRNSLGLKVEPHKAMRTLAYGKDLMNGSNGIFSCCECGICTYYACNFGLKPSVVMGRIKASMQRAGVKPMKKVHTSADIALVPKKLPTNRLVRRLGLSEYDVDAPMDDSPIGADIVKIPLKMHIGAPSNPVVGVGLQVKKGDLIADIPTDAVGAKIHASIDGKVTDVTENYVEIRV